MLTSISKCFYLLSFSKILGDTLLSLGTKISLRKQIFSYDFLQLYLTYLHGSSVGMDVETP